MGQREVLTVHAFFRPVMCFKEFGFIASSNLERFGLISAMQ